jgi:hypothetical protein
MVQVSEKSPTSLPPPATAAKFALQPLEQSLLAAFISLLVVPLLYLLRSVDNNTLTSWQWTMADGTFGRLYPFIIPAILFSFALAPFLALEKYGKPVLLFLVALTLVPLWQAPEMLLDTGRYFLQGKFLATQGLKDYWLEWGHGIWNWTDLPLSSFTYGLLMKLFGEHRAVLQLFNTLLFCGTTLLVYGIGHALHNRETGFYAAFLLFGLPFLLTQIPQVLNDGHVMFCLAATLYTFIHGLREGVPRRLSLGALALASLFLVKYSAWLTLLLLPALVWSFPEISLKERARRALLMFCGAALLAGLFLVGKKEVILAQLDLLRSYQSAGLLHWQENWLSTLFFQSHPFIILLAIAGSVRAFRSRNRGFLALLVLPLTLIILDIERSRYLLPYLPLITLLAAYGLQALPDVRLKQGLATGIVAVSAIILQGAYLPFFKTTSMMNLLNAGAYLDTMHPTGATVTVLPQQAASGSTAAAVPILDLYTKVRLEVDQSWPSHLSPRPSPYETSLEFTRQLPRPGFYRPSGSSPNTNIIIASSPLTLRLQRDRRVATALHWQEFTKSSPAFRYKTLVAVARPSF